VSPSLPERLVRLARFTKGNERYWVYCRFPPHAVRPCGTATACSTTILPVCYTKRSSSAGIELSMSHNEGTSTESQRGRNSLSPLAVKFPPSVKKKTRGTPKSRTRAGGFHPKNVCCSTVAYVEASLYASWVPPTGFERNPHWRWFGSPPPTASPDRAPDSTRSARNPATSPSRWHVTRVSSGIPLSDLAAQR
jgi:hypothetical protein